MKCEELYKEILRKYKIEYINKYLITQCYRLPNGTESYIVINDKKTKVSLSLFFEKSYYDEKFIYADYILRDQNCLWQLKSSENIDENFIINIVILLLKHKHYTRSEKKYLANNLMPLFIKCNFEKMKLKYDKKIVSV